MGLGRCRRADGVASLWPLLGDAIGVRRNGRCLRVSGQGRGGSPSCRHQMLIGHTSTFFNGEAHGCAPRAPKLLNEPGMCTGQGGVVPTLA